MFTPRAAVRSVGVAVLSVLVTASAAAALSITMLAWTLTLAALTTSEMC